MDADTLLGLLGEPDRLRVVSALVLGHGTVEEIARVSGLTDKEAGRALGRLAAAGLVTRDEAGYRFVIEEVKTAARLAGARRDEDDFETPHQQTRVLRSFIKDGHLTTIPVVRSKRLVVLDYIAQRFDPGVRYTEADVNEMLVEFHEDVASLRRYLVDEGFMMRDRGVYWRVGGTVEIY